MAISFTLVLFAFRSFSPVLADYCTGGSVASKGSYDCGGGGAAQCPGGGCSSCYNPDRQWSCVGQSGPYSECAKQTTQAACQAIGPTNYDGDPIICIGCIWVVTSTPPPGCTFGPWYDFAGCGQAGCSPTDKKQQRDATSGGCQSEQQCVSCSGGGGGGTGSQGCDGACSTNADCASGLSCKINGHPGCWGNACESGGGGGQVTVTNTNPLCTGSTQNIKVKSTGGGSCTLRVRLYKPKAPGDNCRLDPPYNGVKCTLVRNWWHDLHSNNCDSFNEIDSWNVGADYGGWMTRVQRMRDNDDDGNYGEAGEIDYDKDFGPGLGFTVNQCTSNIQARAVEVGGAIDCASLFADAAYIGGTIFSLSPVTVPNNQTQSGGTWVAWNGIPTGSYTVSGTPPAGYTQQTACYTDKADLSAPYIQSATGTLINGKPLSWMFGYLKSPSWWQAQGGVTAVGGVKSELPSGSSLDNTSGSGNVPGVIVTGNNSLNVGSGSVSSTNWKVDTNAALYTNLWAENGYDILYARLLGNVTTTTVSVVNALGDLTSGIQTDGVYFVQSVGDLDINNPINLGDNKVVILSGGNVNVKGALTLNDNTGFLMILAAGSIKVDQGVGVSGDPNAIGRNPDIEGLFVAKQSFDTGASSTNTLKVRGVVAAGGGVNFQRSVFSSTFPSELFVFGPDQVVLMPKETMRKNLTWEEVAP